MNLLDLKAKIYMCNTLGINRNNCTRRFGRTFHRENPPLTFISPAQFFLRKGHHRSTTINIHFA